MDSNLIKVIAGTLYSIWITSVSVVLDDIKCVDGKYVLDKETYEKLSKIALGDEINLVGYDQVLESKLFFESYAISIIREVLENRSYKSEEKAN